MLFFFDMTGSEALTDKAVLTYLDSLVEGISEELKYALVAGAGTSAVSRLSPTLPTLPAWRYCKA